MRLPVALALSLSAPLLPAPAIAEDVTVFAAASLKDALDAYVDLTTKKAEDAK